MRGLRIMIFLILLPVVLRCEREGIYDLASHEDSIQVLYSIDGFATTSWDVSHDEIVFPDVTPTPGSTQYDFKIVNTSDKDIILTGPALGVNIVEFFTPEFTSPGAPVSPHIMAPGTNIIFIIKFDATVIGEYYSPAYIRYLDAGDSQEWVYAFEVRGRGI
jgi:hypothetical protein